MSRSGRRTVPILAVILIGALTPTTARSADGWDLDQSFGGDGIVTTAVGSGLEIGNAVAVYPPGSPNGDTGKIVVAGSVGVKNSPRNDVLVTRYKPDGSLDTSFGSGGVVVTDYAFGMDDKAFAVAIYSPLDQNAGKIVVAGEVERVDDGVKGFLAIRYNHDGSLDGSFGSGGKAATWFSNDPSCDRSRTICDSPATAYDVVLRASGDIVLAGVVRWGPPLNDDFALAMFDKTGQLEPLFGTGGKVTTDIRSSHGFDEAHAVTLSSDFGKILVAGTVTEGSTHNLAIAAYNPLDGSLASGFGINGRIAESAFGNTTAWDIAAYPAGGPQAGNFLVAGQRDDPGASPQVHTEFYVARFLADSGIDSSFGLNGSEETIFEQGADEARRILLQPDGKIVLVGYIKLPDGRLAFGLTRFTKDGKNDFSFGDSNDIVETSIGDGHTSALGAALDAQDRIVAAGWTQVSSSDPSDTSLALARYVGPTGSIDFKASVGDLASFITRSQYTIRWSSSGAPGDVKYDVRKTDARFFQRAFGNWPGDSAAWDVFVRGTAATQRKVETLPGTSVCYEVRGHSEGFSTAWSAPSCTAIPVDDRTLDKVPSSAWGSFELDGCFRGTYTGTSGGGTQSVHVEATFKRLAILIARGPGFGTVTIEVNGKALSKKVSLNAGSLACGVIVPVKTYTSIRRADIDVVASKPGKGVYIDGIGVSLT
jgi:uncharacterized delta-60 repeat protein